MDSCFLVVSMSHLILTIATFFKNEILVWLFCMFGWTNISFDPKHLKESGGIISFIVHGLLFIALTVVSW